MTVNELVLKLLRYPPDAVVLRQTERTIFLGELEVDDMRLSAAKVMASHVEGPTVYAEDPAGARVLIIE